MKEHVHTNISSKKKTSFSADVLRLTSGAVFSQIMLVLAAPFLTRLYRPAAFGAFALFSSITGIIVIISCMCYESSIVLPKEDGEAVNLLGVSLAFVIVISLLTIPIVWFIGPTFLRWLRASILSSYLWFIPPAVFIGGLFSALSYWSSRTKRFTQISLARVMSSTTTVSAQLGAGYAGYTAGGGLIGAHVMGQAVAAAVLGGQIWQNQKKLLVRSMRWHKMVLSLRKYKKFPLFSTWSAILNTISSQLPIFILIYFFSPIVAGFYILGYRLINLPMALVGRSIAQVFFQRASVAKHDGSLNIIVEKTFQKLLLLAVFPFLLLMIIAPEFFKIVFGSEWVEAGVYVQILIPWFFFVFLGSPIATLNAVLEFQGVNLVFNIILLILRTVSLIIGGMQQNILLTLLYFSISGTITWLWFCFYVFSKTGFHWLRFVKCVISRLLIASACLIPAVLAKWIFSSNAYIIVLVGIIATIFYYKYVFYLKPEQK